MQGADAVSSVVNAVLSAAVLAGLAMRGRLDASRFFVYYLGFGLVLRVLTWAHPAFFYAFEPWLVFDTLHVVLRFGVAAELLWACFGRLPGGARKARGLLVCAAALSLAAAFLPPTPAPPEWGPLYPLWQRITHSGYVLGLAFVAIVAVTVRHGLPMDPLHRAIAVGMSIFCFVQVMRPLVSLDDWMPLGRGALMKLGYPLVLLVWLRAAWQTDTASALSPAAMRLLQPWRRPA